MNDSNLVTSTCAFVACTIGSVLSTRKSLLSLTLSSIYLLIYNYSPTTIRSIASTTTSRSLEPNPEMLLLQKLCTVDSVALYPNNRSLRITSCTISSTLLQCLAYDFLSEKIHPQTIVGRQKRQKSSKQMLQVEFPACHDSGQSQRKSKQLTTYLNDWSASLVAAMVW